MKKLFSIIFIGAIVFFTIAASNIDYDLNTGPALTDQLIMLDDPTGTWATNRVSLQSVYDLFEGEMGTIIDYDIETTMTDSANVPTSAAIIDYADSNWGGGSYVRDSTDPTDDTWQGDTITDAVAGEALNSTTGADQWKVLYIKDTGSGSRYYLYNANSTFGDSDDFEPLSLLASTATVAAGGTITVTTGPGILRNDGYGSFAAADIGKSLYCGESAGAVSLTAPNDSDDMIKKVATVLNIEDNGGDVFEFRWGHPWGKIP